MPNINNTNCLVMFGPKACGKTRYAKKIAQHFGLERIADNWRAKAIGLQANTLHICVADPGPEYPSISFRAAMQLANIKLPTDTGFRFKEIQEHGSKLLSVEPN